MSNLETNKTIALRLIEIFNGREPRRFGGPGRTSSTCSGGRSVPR